MQGGGGTSGTYQSNQSRGDINETKIFKISQEIRTEANK